MGYIRGGHTDDESGLLLRLKFLPQLGHLFLERLAGILLGVDAHFLTGTRGAFLPPNQVDQILPDPYEG